jgi:hypothetical protein
MTCPCVQLLSKTGIENGEMNIGGGSENGARVIKQGGRKDNGVLMRVGVGQEKCTTLCVNHS